MRPRRRAPIKLAKSVAHGNPEDPRVGVQMEKNTLRIPPIPHPRNIAKACEGDIASSVNRLTR
jgi:hypothetical protein